MTKQLHPALALFQELFTKWATPDNPDLPEYIVARSPFIMELKRRGIEHPDNIIKFFEWEKEIGLHRFAKRIIKAHRLAIKQRQEQRECDQWKR